MPPQQFQNQMAQSPYRGRGSPAFTPAQPHMPQGMHGNPQMPYPGYPQHLNPQYQVSKTPFLA